MNPSVRASRSREVRGGAGPSADVRGDVMDGIFERLGATVPVVFYFVAPLDEEVLVRGLEAALARLPLFSGRLRRGPDGLTIVCNDSGARFSSADVDLELRDAVAAPIAADAAWLVDMVAPGAARAGSGALLTARLTRYRGGATALGCCWHHSLGDMSTFMGLMTAWSAAVEGRDLPTPRLVGDRRAHFAGAIADGVAPPGVRMLGWGEVFRLGLLAAGRRRTVQVFFTAPEIARMREALAGATGVRLSANDVLCAHLSTLLRDAEGDGAERLLAITVDLRRRLGLEPGLLGNLVSGIRVPYGAADRPEDVATRVRAAVDDYARSHSDYHSTLRFVDGLTAGQRKRCLPLEVDPLRKTLLVTNWSKFGVYDLSFGGQRPAYFSPVSRAPVPWISALVEGPGGAGMIYTAMLPRRVADALERPEFAARLHSFRHPTDEIPELVAGVAL